MSFVKDLYYEIEDFKLSIPEWNLLDEGVTALCGPSGSGKTTLVKILCGLIPCPSLKWQFKGEDLASLNAFEKQIGVLFQELHLFPHMTAKENILFALEARGYSLSEKKQEFNEIIQFLKIEKKLNLFSDQLSGGEKQRVALARALLNYPRFLILDEPFSSLDSATKKEACFLTKEIIKKRRLPALFISHNSQEVKYLADKVFILEDGSLKS